MAVVRLPWRKSAERDEKRPELGLSSGPGGSDNLPGMAAVCGIPTADQQRKKNVPPGHVGGGKLTRSKHSFRWGALKHCESALRTVLCHWLRCSSAKTAAPADVADDYADRGALAAQPEAYIGIPDQCASAS